MNKLPVLALALLVALGGCKGSQPEKQGQAGGAILPGSASDGMLPLDRVTSQPPLAPKVEKAADASASEAPDPDVGAADAAAPAPAELAKPEG